MNSPDDSVDDSAPNLEQLMARFFGPDPPAMQIRFGALSDRGHRRKKNEDHFAVVKRQRTREVLLTNLPEHVLPHSADESYAMVVADGMGGAAFGELASMLALRTGWDLTSQSFKWPFRISEHESQELFKQIELYGQLMNKAINKMASQDPELTGMGTTLTGAILVAGEAFIGHVGDSRAYLYRASELMQITDDHTMAQELVNEGMLSSIDEAQSFMQHVLVNCLGGKDENVRVETHRMKLQNGDRLMLCTDGLTDMVTDEEISRVFSQSFDVQKTCDELGTLALDHGGRDNITLIIANIVMKS